LSRPSPGDRQRRKPLAIEAVRAGSGDLLCSVTVVTVRRRRHLVAAMWQWFKVRRQMRGLDRPPIASRTALDVRTGTLTFLTLWPDVRSLLVFNGLSAHVLAIHWVIDGGHRTWTGIFRPVGLSALSLRDGEPTWLDTLTLTDGGG
jgi:hypothetical protein